MTIFSEVREERDAALNALRRLVCDIAATPDAGGDELRGALAEGRATVQRLDMADARRDADAAPDELEQEEMQS